MRPFYEFLREERQYCAVLAHLLMSSGANSQAFLTLVNSRFGEGPPQTYSDEMEVYVEYAYLRDAWDSLKAPLRVDPRKNRIGTYEEVNSAKRTFILDLLARVPELASLAPPPASEGVAAWNEYFMGETGKKVVREIASPALWPVRGLADRFTNDPEVFYELCRFKWSFRIKPDLVVVLPGQPSICVEAKMESGEGTYPSGDECKIVDGVMKERRRCRQFDLQDFMFNQLLEMPTRQVVIARANLANGTPTLLWPEVFDALDASSSIPFVQRFLDSNRHLLPTRA